jgi:hypothetical protein
VRAIVDNEATTKHAKLSDPRACCGQIKIVLTHDCLNNNFMTIKELSVIYLVVGVLASLLNSGTVALSSGQKFRQRRWVAYSADSAICTINGNKDVQRINDG